MCIETSSESFCKESSAIYLIERPVQWNLSIADMLFSGHLSIAETIMVKNSVKFENERKTAIFGILPAEREIFDQFSCNFSI